VLCRVQHLEDPKTDPARATVRLGIAAAAAIGADLVGVDLLPIRHGHLIIEFNGAADFDSTYSLPGQDVFREAATAHDLLSERPHTTTTTRGLEVRH
jgi:glutathione synthase/RimK-type ligase-like ATP-grasp enzyme